MTPEQIDDIFERWDDPERPSNEQAREDVVALLDEVARLRPYERKERRIRLLAGDLDDRGKHKQARAIFAALNAEQQPTHIAPALARLGLK